MEVKIVGNVILYENMNVGDYFRYNDDLCRKVDEAWAFNFNSSSFFEVIQTDKEFPLFNSVDIRHTHNEVELRKLNTGDTFVYEDKIYIVSKFNQDTNDCYNITDNSRHEFDLDTLVVTANYIIEAVV